MLWIALVLGLVEGLTEFLPISSTGHLIIASELMQFDGPRRELFVVFIQLGAILSVVWEFRDRLIRVAADLPHSSKARGFAFRVFLAFLPSAAVGLFVHDFLMTKLFAPAPVSAALITGALLIFVVEALPLEANTHEAELVTPRQAIGIGLAQCLALWPGFSRSAATILGGLTVGLDRRAATEFSFFVAIPTMFGAGFYDLFKLHHSLEPGDAKWLALSFVISFFVAWASIRWLLRFVSSHSFRPFAWYRLAVGTAILIALNVPFFSRGG